MEKHRIYFELLFQKTIFGPKPGNRNTIIPVSNAYYICRVHRITDGFRIIVEHGLEHSQ
jgi:hypothetical protein